MCYFNANQLGLDVFISLLMHLFDWWIFGCVFFSSFVCFLSAADQYLV